MQYEELVKSYEGKSDEELLRLRLDSEELTAEASAPLMGELAKRGIGRDRIKAFRDLEAKRKEELSRNPGNLFFTFRLGDGTSAKPIVSTIQPRASSSSGLRFLSYCYFFLQSLPEAIWSKKDGAFFLGN